MGTNVTIPAEVAEVECPKKTGEMDKNRSCHECQYWARCMRAIMGVLGADS